MNREFKPRYLNIWETILFYLITLIRDFRNPVLRDAYSLKNTLVSFSLRKKLLLTKLIKFNNHYYSTLSLPAFPSKAFENTVKKGGMNFNAAGTLLKRQTDTALLAFTSKCVLNCTHCYERQNINSEFGVPVDKWINIVKELQLRGTSIIILTGGEPLIEFDNLLKILESGDKNLSDFHIHTSGYSVTKHKVKELKKAGLTAAGVGLDDYSKERHNKIRGNHSFEQAVNALRLFNEEGILTYVNFCVHKEILKEDELLKYYEFVKSLNVSLIELLEPRPCGGLINESAKDLISEKDKKTLLSFTLAGNTTRKYHNYPLIYYLSHIEGKDQMGCMMAGLSHFYIDSAGNVNPCVFMPVTFGNIMKDDFELIFKKMRMAVPSPVHTDCPSILLSEKIKENKNSGIPVPFDKISDEWSKTLTFH